MISCWKNSLSTELFNIDNSTAEKLILFPTYCSYVLTFLLCTLLISIPIVLTVNSYQFPHMLLRFDEINVFILFIYQIAT